VPLALAVIEPVSAKTHFAPIVVSALFLPVNRTSTVSPFKNHAIGSPKMTPNVREKTSIIKVTQKRVKVIAP